jgi:hypothetical protein
MIPTKIRNRIFDQISGITMRKFFTPVSLTTAGDLAREVLTQSQRDFFVNGTITSHAACPILMAGMWSGGREVVLTNGQLPAWLKKALGASLSEVNQCPYCEDFLLSLTHGAKENDVAVSLRKRNLDAIQDELTRKRLQWAKASVDKHAPELNDPPFSADEMPEALGTLVVFGYTNKISDFTMEGSPIPNSVRSGALRLFGMELQESAELDLEHGTSLNLLPSAELPEDLWWAADNPLVAEGLARWNGVVEQEINHVLSPDVQDYIRRRLESWEGGPPPLSRSWVEEDISGLSGREKDLARVALLVAKASYQIDDKAIERVVAHGTSEAELVRLGAWGALIGAKTAASWAARTSAVATSG